MRSKFKIGMRVQTKADVGMGLRGEVVGAWELGPIVRFDVAPPREYNMGENPTAMLDYHMELEANRG